MQCNHSGIFWPYNTLCLLVLRDSPEVSRHTPAHKFQLSFNVNNNTYADIENKDRPTVMKTKTLRVILIAIYHNIGHRNWPPVRGKKCVFCTDLLAASRGWPPVNAQRNWPLMPLLPGRRPSEGPFKRGSTVVFYIVLDNTIQIYVGLPDI